MPSVPSQDIDARTVRHVAKLARLRLTDDEAAAFAGQLSSILGAFEELSKVDASRFVAAAAPAAMRPFLREDKAEALFSPDEILANAPERSGHLFKVPPVV